MGIFNCHIFYISFHCNENLIIETIQYLLPYNLDIDRLIYVDMGAYLCLGQFFSVQDFQ